MVCLVHSNGAVMVCSLTLRVPVLTLPSTTATTDHTPATLKTWCGSQGVGGALSSPGQVGIHTQTNNTKNKTQTNTHTHHWKARMSEMSQFQYYFHITLHRFNVVLSTVQ